MSNNQIQSIKTAKLGDKILLTDGDVVEFIRLKRTKFLGRLNGKNYDIPVAMFKEFVEKAPENNNDFETLEKGELFYINKGDNKAILFEFEELEIGRIIALNPIDGNKASIHTQLYGGKVSDLKKKTKS